ncbi:MAG TPA: DUF4230 domain-containing protein [Planctomycetaceae bacterium]|nr:DUF4230 domain-containing protein [Planctomycetaceae bacterium]
MNEPLNTAEPPVRRSSAAPLAIGAGLFIGLALLLHSQQSEFVSTSNVVSQLDESGKLRPLAEVIETTRALKLVTVTIDSRVRTEMRDERWRGTASASVEVPVRYVYGVDLSQLDPDAFRLGKLLGMYEIAIPHPVRIAAEVDGSHPFEEVVEVTGTRFKSRAGEYYLGLARKDIYEQARKSTLPKETLDDIDAKTREQVETLVHRFVGPSAQVRVRFQDQPVK